MLVEMVISIDISGFTLLASPKKQKRKKINLWNDPKSISLWLYIPWKLAINLPRTNAFGVGWVAKGVQKGREVWTYVVLQREIKQDEDRQITAHLSRPSYWFFSLSLSLVLLYAVYICAPSRNELMQPLSDVKTFPEHRP